MVAGMKDTVARVRDKIGGEARPGAAPARPSRSP
jgi:hypothetical protein